MSMVVRRKLNPWLVAIGVLLLCYAILGNYVALPGYLRFLERGGTSAAGNSFDLSVLVGATKTILWMYSFQLGVLVLSIAYLIRKQIPVTPFTVVGLLWLALWSWPTISPPSAWFYLFFGSLIVLAIILYFVLPERKSAGDLSEMLFVGAIVFFSFATWEVCGLGSTGRMLHPDQSSAPLANNILVTQSTKLMLEFVLAWSLLLVSQREIRKPAAV